MEPTTDQKKQLNVWSEQRDSLLLEISSLASKKEDLTKENKILSESNADIEKRMDVIYGRIEELIIKEKEMGLMTHKNVVELRIEKSTLQTEVSNLMGIIADLNSQKDLIKNDISFLSDTLKSMNDRVGLLDKVVGDTTETNQHNINIIESLFSSVKTGLESIIKVNKEAVEKTNSVIKDLPSVFLEVKRQSLERDIIKKVKP